MRREGISARCQSRAGGQGLKRAKEKKNKRKRIEKRHICALRVFHDESRALRPVAYCFPSLPASHSKQPPY
jgi:hypothetical protein